MKHQNTSRKHTFDDTPELCFKNVKVLIYDIALDNYEITYLSDNYNVNCISSVHIYIMCDIPRVVLGNQ